MFFFSTYPPLLPQPLYMNYRSLFVRPGQTLSTYTDINERYYYQFSIYCVLPERMIFLRKPQGQAALKRNLGLSTNSPSSYI